MNRLLNKVAIITGADGGICGKACELFCQKGAKVVMNDIDPHVEEACAKIRENGGEVVAVVGDASKRETWDKLLATALGWNGSGFQGYPMSKAAIKNGTLNMVKQVSPKTGIRFNCLAPNFVWTPKTSYLYENERTLGWFKAVTPFPELGKPEDSAWAMVYLCSDEAKYINGVVLPTDGGWTTCN